MRIQSNDFLIQESIEIGDDAFYHCISLSEIKLPDSVVTIGERAFRFCNEIKIFEIPQNVKNIAFLTFSDCHALEKVILPEQLETIGVYAFFNCYKLREINISFNIISIGEDAFRNTLIMFELVNTDYLLFLLHLQDKRRGNILLNLGSYLGLRAPPKNLLKALSESRTGFFAIFLYE